MKTEITVDAIAENNDKVIDFINGILAEAECSKKAIVQLDVAVEEIFVNIAHYAYAPGSGKARIIVEVLKDSSAVRITFIDSGKPYDPLAKQDPDITLSSEERKIGGLGIYIVKKSMDEVTYEYKDGCNNLSIFKKIS